MPSRTAAPLLTLAPGTGASPEAAAALAVLESMHQLVASHVADWHEGPGALVPPEVWFPAVRRLGDALLRPAADRAGVVVTPSLTTRAARVADALYGEKPVLPAGDRAPWSGRLVVVLGAGRSGTTWLETMLMASPDAGGLDGEESFLFKVCHPLWVNAERLAPLADRERLVPVLQSFTDLVLEEALTRHCPGARVFVEKTPLHSLMVDQIAALYPDAFFLHLLRDGRDVARSMSQVPFFNVPDPADAARLWRRVLEAVNHHAPALAHFKEQRYEDLLGDPVSAVLGLMDWAGLRHDAATREELARRAVRRVSAHAGTSQQVGTETWQAMSRRDLARVLGECGTELVREGYLGRAQLARHGLSPAYWSRRLPRARTRVVRALRLR